MCQIIHQLFWWWHQVCKVYRKHSSIIWLLSFPIATALSSISNKSPKGFDINIKPVIILNPTKKAWCPFELMNESSQSNSIKFSSKFSHRKVQDFLVGFWTAPLKLAFLGECPPTNNPSFHDQIEVILFSFLNKASLGYQSGSGREAEKVRESTSLAIAVLSFIHNHHDSLSTQQVTRFKSSVLIVNLQHVICTKVNQGKKKSLSKDKLNILISKTFKCILVWPSNYYDKNQVTGDRNGEPIIAKIENVMKILLTNKKISRGKTVGTLLPETWYGWGIIPRCN